MLTEPKNALVKQYQQLFAMEERRAAVHRRGPAGDRQARPRQRETGARGLRSIIEEVMLDIMFELPEQPRGSRYVINDDVVEGRQHAVRAAADEECVVASRRCHDVASTI